VDSTFVAPSKKNMFNPPFRDVSDSHTRIRSVRNGKRGKIVKEDEQRECLRSHILLPQKATH
jgi:hypothetical protein